VLVLSRKRRESVDIGDEVVLTVEEILGGENGQERIAGATVRLGFQSPRDIPIFRSELRSVEGDRTCGEGRARPGRPRAGECVKIPNARVRLRIQVPKKIPVRFNGILSAPLDPGLTPHPATHETMSVYRITCREDDRVAICNNIVVVTLGVHRFVFLSRISH